MEEYFYLYQITNTKNGKIYVGVHKTKNLDDNYMGSGKFLKRAIRKHGIENFEKTILAWFDSRESMFKAESEIVNESFIKRDDTYNIKEGGSGGFDYINKNGKNTVLKKVNEQGLNNKAGQCYILINRLKEDIEYATYIHDKASKALKEHYKTHPGTFTGRSHTEQTKKKISKANSEKLRGKANAMYGKMWIYNEDLKISKRISKQDPIPNGWKKGRKIKF